MRSSTLLESMDLGRFGSNVEQIIDRVNIPYTYLPAEVRINPRGLMDNLIQPYLQEMSRRGQIPTLMKEEIAAEKERMDVEKMSVSTFIAEVERVYLKKINIQHQIAQLIKGCMNGEIPKDRFMSNGADLLEKSSLIEPTFFAAGSIEKKYKAYCLDQMPSGLSLEERMLVSGPAIPAFSITYELDLREYLASGTARRREMKKVFLIRYFNNDALYMESALEKYKTKMSFLAKSAKDRSELLSEISDIREDLKGKWNRKVYFMVERKVPLVEELDRIFTFDDCFDQYFSIKCCFLHDLFLKAHLIDLLNSREMLNSSSTFEEIGEKIQNALRESDKDLVRNIRKGL